MLLSFLIGSLGLSACDPQVGRTLKIGNAAPNVVTQTLQDVGGDFSKITTYRYPDARMYQWSVDKALKTGKPLVLEFATPGHCTVCDNQLQMLKALMQKYDPDILFLHLDQYQNPQAFKAFGVMGDPWTIVVDPEGIVQFTRPGRMLYNELDPILKKLTATQLGLSDEQRKQL